MAEHRPSEVELQKLEEQRKLDLNEMTHHVRQQMKEHVDLINHEVNRMRMALADNKTVQLAQAALAAGQLCTIIQDELHRDGYKLK